MKIPWILPYSKDDKSLQKGRNLLQPIRNREIFSVQKSPAFNSNSAAWSFFFPAPTLLVNILY